MSKVPDSFLLELAGIAASLLGFFVIGVFFYVQRGMFPQAADQARRYLQAATRSVIFLYAMALSLSLFLVVLDVGWVAVAYAGLSLILLWSVARTSSSIRDLHKVLDIRVMSQVVMWAAAAAVVALPWALGGLHPSRSHLVLAILAIGALAFTCSASLVLSTFDISRLEGMTGDARRDRRTGGSMSGDNRTVTAAVDKHISRFGERLHSILGKGRIPRRDKKAKAEAAMRAVDDLVGSIEGEVGRLDDPAPSPGRYAQRRNQG